MLLPLLLGVRCTCRSAAPLLLLLCKAFAFVFAFVFASVLVLSRLARLLDDRRLSSGGSSSNSMAHRSLRAVCFKHSEASETPLSPQRSHTVELCSAIVAAAIETENPRRQPPPLPSQSSILSCGPAGASRKQTVLHSGLCSRDVYILPATRTSYRVGCDCDDAVQSGEQSAHPEAERLSQLETESDG